MSSQPQPSRPSQAGESLARTVNEILAGTKTHVFGTRAEPAKEECNDIQRAHEEFKTGVPKVEMKKPDSSSKTKIQTNNPGEGSLINQRTPDYTVGEPSGSSQGEGDADTKGTTDGDGGVEKGTSLAVANLMDVSKD